MPSPETGSIDPPLPTSSPRSPAIRTPGRRSGNRAPQVLELVRIEVVREDTREVLADAASFGCQRADATFTWSPCEHPAVTARMSRARSLRGGRSARATRRRTERFVGDAVHDPRTEPEGAGGRPVRTVRADHNVCGSRRHVDRRPHAPPPRSRVASREMRPGGAVASSESPGVPTGARPRRRSETAARHGPRPARRPGTIDRAPTDGAHRQPAARLVARNSPCRRAARARRRRRAGMPSSTRPALAHDEHVETLHAMRLQSSAPGGVLSGQRERL